MDIKRITDKDVKEKISLEIMNGLPAWFSPPEDIIKKSCIHREMDFFASYEKYDVTGFISLKEHNHCTVEIYNFGVKEKFHRKGTGTSLLSAAEKYLSGKGYIFLTVKTLDFSAEYEPYERTRRFYLKNGFHPLEVFHRFWDEDNPCLFLCKLICK